MSGYIPPLGAAPSADIDLDLVFQALVKGITGLPGSMVRPRWQVTPPTQPPINTNWVGVSVVSETPDQYGFLETRWYPEALPDPAYTNLLFHRHWSLEVLASFYGPAASAYAARMQNGFHLPQNLDELRRTSGIAFQETAQQLLVPELIDQQWYRRVDVTSIFRIKRSTPYAGAELQSAIVTVNP